MMPSPGVPPGPQAAARKAGLLTRETGVAALKQSFVMLRPDIQWKNPVMFVVEVGAVLTLLFIVQAAMGQGAARCRSPISSPWTAWLILTVLFANFATALAEARGKAQAESPPRAPAATPSPHRLRGDGGPIEEVSSTELKAGRRRRCVEAGQIIPGDGEIVEGVASVNEPPSPANRPR